ncbi:hypothetical protein [Actinomadura rubrisoli]|uniref:DUF2530 domain-containing protein n=1 Tax=Actinomadura rubrisoli TaxID=2530368 RepID=A0A4R5B5C4_9ACTN|nr:hypothetical protein [Actinomadura rubrisoli]TDD80475.1 hypothetical protein E1298_25755 [Actinomadura rubrisoli]
MPYVEYEPPERPPGIFIPRDTLLVSGIVTAGVVVAALVWLAPVVGVPIGVGTGVTGLLFTLWSHRHRSAPLDRPLPPGEPAGSGAPEEAPR